LDVNGLVLLPKSILFDDKTKIISILSLQTDSDVIPTGNESIDVTVVVTATANQNMTASSNFTVTLIDPNFGPPVIEETVLVINEAIPFFSVLGNSTLIPALPIRMAKNETTVSFDLGKLLYAGNPSDTFSIVFDSSSVPFAIVENKGEDYSLLIDLSLVDANYTIKSGKKYSSVGEVQIVQASNGQVRNEKLIVRFKLNLAESEVEEEIA